MKARAPGVVKLFGEHAVVYGKLSVAAALDMYATVDLEPTGSNELEIIIPPPFGIDVSFGAAQLSGLYLDYKGRAGVAGFLEKHADLGKVMLPYATIAARLQDECGIRVTGFRATITSEIPRESGCASSAACSTAFAAAFVKANGKALPDETVIDVSRDGERVAHRNDNAGLIDVYTSFYGGIVSYSKGSGVSRVESGGVFDTVVINTGPKRSTAEMVGLVSDFYKADTERASALFDRIDACSKEGLAAIRGGDVERFGSLMFENQAMLKELGVSSDGLDSAVLLAKEKSACGAKLSGGGGGGAAVAVARPGLSEGIIAAMKEKGFDAFGTRISSRGALAELSGPA